MRYLIFGFFMLYCAGKTSGQQTFALRTAFDSVSFRVVEQDGKLGLEWIGKSIPFEKQKEFPTITGISLQDADLVVVYQSRKMQDGFLNRLDFQLSVWNEGRQKPQFQREEMPGPNSGELQMAWMDATEDLLFLGKTYTLYIQWSLLGAVDCNKERPVFSLPRQLPHYAVAVAGLALAGIGQIYNNQKKDTYHTYQQYWSDEKSGADAARFLQDARKNEKTSNACFSIAGALFAADIVWTSIRYRKIRRAQSDFDKYCAPNKPKFSSIKPVFQSTPSQFAAPAPGLKMTFSF